MYTNIDYQLLSYPKGQSIIIKINRNNKNDLLD